jgi:anthraniloyl-CoA monooxygenase
LADDRHRNGLQPDDAVAMARGFSRHGAQLFDITAGLTLGTDATAGDYRRMYQVQLADRIRNDARVPTIASGRITTIDEINTVVAAGRADLCVLDPRAYRR